VGILYENNGLISIACSKEIIEKKTVRIFLRISFENEKANNFLGHCFKNERPTSR
jgi:hypothetical protein